MSATTPTTQTPQPSARPGGSRELIALSLPLILSSSFWTIQITVERVFLSWYDPDAVGAAMVAAMVFWTPMALLQNTIGYATTFVAQYLGANRPERIGPIVWQGLYLSLGAALVFGGLMLLGPTLMAWAGHSPRLQALENVYFRYLCYAGLPLCVVAATNAFFAGRGDSWTVLLVDAFGTLVNTVTCYALIFGKWGLPEWGIEGAGVAMVLGPSAAAALGLALFWRPKYRRLFATDQRRFDWLLMRRLLWFGVPNGLQWALEGLAFTVFLLILGRIGDIELAASSMAFTINLVAVLPMIGLGQGVLILVGQRLGQDQPDLAQRTTWAGFRIAWVYMSGVALLYFFAPQLFVALFDGDTDPDKRAAVAALVPMLLRFVAAYSLFDSLNIIFSFALRGAGDTRFVSLVALTAGWPLAVLPTYIAWKYQWDLVWPWVFVTVYIIAVALILMARFIQGRWRTMRVIEPSARLPEDDPASASTPASAGTPAAERAAPLP
jgi:MATE family multidrug resistance protein